MTDSSAGPSGQKTFACKVFGGAQVTRDKCRTESLLPRKNTQFCTTYKCACPWRICTACSLQGYSERDSRVIDAKIGLCKFHTEKGSEARRPREETKSSPSLTPYLLAPSRKEPEPIREASGPTPAPAVLKEPPAPKPEAKVEPAPKPQSPQKDPQVPAVRKSKTEVSESEKQTKISEAYMQELKRIRDKYKFRAAVDIPIAQVCPNPNQPRTHFDKDAMDSLIESIKQVGQQESALVVEHKGEGDVLYMILDGERRYRACVATGEPTYSAIVCDPMDAKMFYAMSVMKNFNREGHTPMEKALAFENLKKEGFTQKQISSIVGETQVNISRFLKLVALTPEARKFVAIKAGEDVRYSGRLQTEVAIELSALPPELQMVGVEKVKGLAVSVARIVIRKMLTEAGVARRTREEKPSTGFRIVKSRISRVHETLDLYLEHDLPSFVKMMKTRTPGERKEIVEEILRIAKRAEKWATFVPKT